MAPFLRSNSHDKSISLSSRLVPKSDNNNNNNNNNKNKTKSETITTISKSITANVVVSLSTTMRRPSNSSIILETAPTISTADEGMFSPTCVTSSSTLGVVPSEVNTTTTATTTKKERVVLEATAATTEKTIAVVDRCIHICGGGDEKRNSAARTSSSNNNSSPIGYNDHYGYGDAAPDPKDQDYYGKGGGCYYDDEIADNEDFDIPMKEVDYGYENAAPDRRRASLSSSCCGDDVSCLSDNNDGGYDGYYDDHDGAAVNDHETTRSNNNNNNKYGYGDVTAAPDDRDKYGYGDAAPDDRDKYGYGDAAPDDRAKYGYGDGAPTNTTTSSSRRGKRRGPRRRRTLGDDDDDDDNDHHDDISCYTSPSLCGSTNSSNTLRSSMRKHGTSRRASIQLGGEISVYLPGQRKVVRRRSIAFDESVKVKKVPKAKNLTKSPAELWFQEEEFKAIRRRSLDIVDKVENGKTGGKKYCIRGLEKMLKSRRKILMERKYDAWDTVLDEQDVQRDSGTFDEEYMANVYKYKTLEPMEEAVLQGKKDYAEIEQYMRSTRKICRRLSM